MKREPKPALITIAWWKENLRSDHNCLMEREPKLWLQHVLHSYVAREWGPLVFISFLFSFWVGKAPLYFTCLGKFRKVEEIIPRPDMELAHKSTQELKCKKNTREHRYMTRHCTFLEGVIRDTVKVWQWPIQSTSLHEGATIARKSSKQQRVAFGVN
jgi:hypothetical protein